MKHLALLVTFLLLSVIACHKEASDKVHVVDRSFVTDDYTEADEAQFVADDTDGDNDFVDAYIADASSIPKVKMQYVVTADTVQKSSTCGIPDKKQKFKKRRVANEDSVTTFFLRGYGFGSPDSSRLRVYGKELGFKGYHQEDSLALTIVKWSDSLIICTHPTIANSVYTLTKGFSLKFLLYRRYKVKGIEKELIRTKACACISRTYAAPYLCAAGSAGLSHAENNRRIDSIKVSFGQTSFINRAGTEIANSTYLQKGTVIGSYDSFYNPAWQSSAIVLGSSNSGDNTVYETYEGFRSATIHFYRKYATSYSAFTHPCFVPCTAGGTILTDAGYPAFFKVY